jgi:hypothetical protein
MVTGSLSICAADRPSTRLVIAMPTRQALQHWDSAHRRRSAVARSVSIDLQVEGVRRGQLPGWLTIDSFCDLRLECADGSARSIAVDAALVGALAETYPKLSVEFLGARTWTVRCDLSMRAAGSVGEIHAPAA